jgi:hypothetical protein
MKGIKVCSNEVEHPSPRGDNSKSINLSKIFFSRTSMPMSIKLDTNHP